MGATVWASCVRYLMFFFNLMFALSGLAILSCGLFFMFIMNTQSSSKFLESGIFMYAPPALIVVGSVIAVIAFFGCCGSAKQNHCMLVSFGILLIILFFAESGILILGYKYGDDIEKVFEAHFNDALSRYYEDNDAQSYMDDWQTQLQCCGVRTAKDYNQPIVPYSCCPSHDPTQECTIGAANPLGCFEAIQIFLWAILYIVRVGILLIVFVQFTGIIFAFCLATSIKRGYEIV